jgi:hypothetical protein
MKNITLGTLTYDHLNKVNAWQVKMDTLEDYDAELEPPQFNVSGEISVLNKEVWCLCSAKFSNGTTHQAAAMCRGDSDEGPLLWSIWNGEKDLSLQLPPSPPPVLKVDGPEPFSAAFGLEVNEVFPIELSVVARFEAEPSIRKVILSPQGIIG